jgi:hypothetical protein
VDCFAKRPDPRVNRTRDHLLIDILVIGLCSILAGGEGFNDMEESGKAKKAWFRTFLKLPNGIPRHDTFNRVFQALDSKAASSPPMRWGVRRKLRGK